MTQGAYLFSLDIKCLLRNRKEYKSITLMQFIADLHIHSHFSRATSRTLDPENLSLWAQKKGITVIGTGDFTHPGWVSELQDKLVETEQGLYKLRPDLQKAFDSRVPASCVHPPRSCSPEKSAVSTKKTVEPESSITLSSCLTWPLCSG